MGLGMDFVNQLVMEEFISGLVANISDKQMIKDNIDKFKKGLDSIDNNTVVMITKLDGKLNATIIKKQDIQGFNIEPSFINLQKIIENIEDDL